MKLADFISELEDGGKVFNKFLGIFKRYVSNCLFFDDKELSFILEELEEYSVTDIRCCDTILFFELSFKISEDMDKVTCLRIRIEKGYVLFEFLDYTYVFTKKQFDGIGKTIDLSFEPSLSMINKNEVEENKAKIVKFAKTLGFVSADDVGLS